VQLLPDVGRLTWSVSITGTKIHIEHTEIEGAVPYWHVQDLWVAQSEWRALYGLRRDLALELDVPFRIVRDRIRYEDLARAPFTPAEPDLHHRNETLSRFADVRLGLQWARLVAPWTVTAGAGAWLPVGRTEGNPFALGHAGLPHQHIQFGTGTVDPMLSVVVSRRFGDWSATASGAARWTLAENSHGYRAGDRYGVTFGVARALPRGLAARAGFEWAREQAEMWDGVLEEEGNLGRSDLFGMVGLAHPTAWGLLAADVRWPLTSDVVGAQMDLPLIVRLSLTR